MDGGKKEVINLIRSAWESLTSRDAMTLKHFDQDDAKTLADLAERREYQHKSSEKLNSKSKKKVDVKAFSEGDIVMYRDITNYDAARDTFIVVSDNHTGVRIRKFKNQLR